MDDEKLPLLAVFAADVFALRTFNIPVTTGTSGHLVGGALVAIVLGSQYAAIIVLSLVLILQGFLFGDGGHTIKAANIITIGVIGGSSGFTVTGGSTVSRRRCTSRPSGRRGSPAPSRRSAPRSSSGSPTPSGSPRA